MEARRKRGLGRGLSALLGDEVPETPEAQAAVRAVAKDAVEVPVELLQSGRFQPRTVFDQEALEDLADSIRTKGILQPILVRRLPEDAERYEIIAGERRWRAAQRAQLHKVPVLIREFSDRAALEVALVENLQRRDLNPLEEAEGYRRLQEEFSHSQEELSRAVGKSRSHVANMMRLLALPDSVKSMVTDGRLSAGHARALLNAEDPAGLAEQVARKGLNVRQTEKLATEKGGVKARRPRQAKAPEKDADTLALERDLANLLGLTVSIEFKGRGGQVVIHYDTLEQLDDILYRLNNPGTTARGGTETEEDDTADAAFAATFVRSESGDALERVGSAVSALADDADADAQTGAEADREADPSGEGDAALDRATADAWAAELAAADEDDGEAAAEPQADTAWGSSLRSRNG